MYQLMFLSVLFNKLPANAEIDVIGVHPGIVSTNLVCYTTLQYETYFHVFFLYQVLFQKLNDCLVNHTAGSYSKSLQQQILLEIWCCRRYFFFPYIYSLIILMFHQPENLWSNGFVFHLTGARSVLFCATNDTNQIHRIGADDNRDTSTKSAYYRYDCKATKVCRQANDWTEDSLLSKRGIKRWGFWAFTLPVLTLLISTINPLLYWIQIFQESSLCVDKRLWKI